MPFGAAPSYGSVAASGLARRVVGIASTYTGRGYWEVAGDGAVFPFGDAQSYGSVAQSSLRAPVVGMARTADGQGYWEVGADGSVYPFGDAADYGDVAADGVATSIVALVPTVSGNGYWEVGADGAVYPYGDAVAFGSGLNAGAATRAVTLLSVPAQPLLMASLNAGWNLLELPSDAPYTAASMIASIQGENPGLSVQILATYANGRFQIYVPGYAADYALRQGEGFFVLSSKAGSWQTSGNFPVTHVTHSLSPGWNLVGVPTPQLTTGQQVCASIPSSINCQEVAAYQNGAYVVYSPGGGGTVTLNVYAGAFVLVQHGGQW
jgi:hypothetical protein